ncbi:hypothetical protein [Gilliamella sp. BG6]
MTDLVKRFMVSRPTIYNVLNKESSFEAFCSIN